MKKFKERFNEFYAFRYVTYTLLYMILGLVFLGLTDLYMIFGYLVFFVLILWFIFVAIPSNRISLIRSRISKELNLEKLVNEEYIKEFIKEKK